MPPKAKNKELELFGPQYVASLETPIGKLWVESDGTRITRVSFNNPGRGRHARRPKVLTEALAQLKAYFAGRRKKFDLPLYHVGSAYRKKVWARLEKIPFGWAVTYADLAAEVGGAARSTGSACGVNPLLIVVPCHRVVGSDGLLTGYAGGLWRKKWLLEHEGVLARELF
ncbi:MAG: methylated-DNA--[protein]-cysteine S-methyltransferase [Flavobacteriales bacterium]|jgi:methylated-DNA-[protein]-cysteine S-methyltransferase|nr:methylated-DNA--[protein]-cysteine S-methyltransferase [Flavobacteriales bacterium]MBK6894208.1 methylated-DNA--[protein]-cysteine S-methyltransferase [Flavobacteriales bacterium]MBK7248141.1 methylated-DNA--[protein]-cysteine S-methyltransferase [Flavobacteriales bacterium]MBK7288444.1 methylated-DNA--[protein]-cysteine S-methyltransferase [Flavobacteriales bacterium]MBK9059677.1 methylated-DNA--[protein]-cysteine S-methyltransferase [Flavobacteriales bacterium]